MRVCFLVALIVCAAVAYAQQENGFYRYPTTDGRTVVFTSEGDLWKVPISGGEAVRLTVHDGEESLPRISPDGRYVAFTAQYEGNTDAYVIPAAGGVPRRLTVHPAYDIVVGWTPNGDVVFRSACESANYSYQLFTVPPDGGPQTRFPLDRGGAISFEPGGDRIAFNRSSLEFRTWKRYRGGWAEDVWVGNTEKREFSAVTDHPARDAFPMWHENGRVYFVSGRSGRANVFSMLPDGSDVVQHTDHEEYDVRWPSMGGDLIVYQLAMDVWAYDIGTDETWKISITLPSDRVQTLTRWVDPVSFLDEFALSPDGGRLAVTSRGQLFSLPVRPDGLVRTVYGGSEHRVMRPVFVGDGDKIACLYDGTGEYELTLFSSDGTGEPRAVTSEGSGWRYWPIVSPDGKWAAFGDEKLRLRLIDLNTSEATTVDSGDYEIRYYTWSADSRTLAYVRYNDIGNGVIYLYDLSTKTSHRVTDPAFESYAPSFDPGGRFLAFASDRHFNPYTDATYAQVVYGNTTCLYLLMLREGEQSPLALSPDGAGAPRTTARAEPSPPARSPRTSRTPHGIAPTMPALPAPEAGIDYEGIEDRIVPLPVEPGYYYGLTVAGDDIYYVSVEPTGWLGPRDPTSLCVFDLSEQEVWTAADGVSDYEIAADGEHGVVRRGNSFYRFRVGSRVSFNHETMVPYEGWTLEVDPKAEWTQMFTDAWRWERDFFYDPEWGGIDWQAERDRYARLLPRISTREELEDLIGELIGELATSHTYVYGGDLRTPQRVRVGLLGADLRPDTTAGAWRFEHVYSGERWDDALSSPLSEPGIDVNDGEYLLAIDGRPLSTDEDYLRRLTGKAGVPVLLTVGPNPTVEGSRDVMVRTMRWDLPTRYREWVLSNRAYVDSVSEGRVGYVHIPDMSSTGFSLFGRDFFSQWTKEGMIVDVRANNGGSVSEILLTILSRPVWYVGKRRYGPTYRAAQNAFYGHMAALCDAETASDGEFFTAGWQQIGLGPVFGERTWGGVIGIRGSRYLRDWGSVTQPEYSSWTASDGERIIEGWGAVPDVEIVNDPASVLEGRDLQLDAALSDVIHRIETEPKELPPPPPFPVRWTPER
jgi:tricorn protease